MHLQYTMSSIFDWEVRQSNVLKHGLGYFHKNCRFLWEKNSKTNWGSTIHYIYTSFNNYFRLYSIFCAKTKKNWKNGFFGFYFKIYKTNCSFSFAMDLTSSNWNVWGRIMIVCLNLWFRNVLTINNRKVSVEVILCIQL